MRNSRLLLIPLIILAVFFLPAASSAEKEDALLYGDALVVASIADCRALVPILASDSASSDICGMVFNCLVKYDKDINIVGDLAESWEILDGGLTIVFHLRRN